MEFVMPTTISYPTDDARYFAGRANSGRHRPVVPRDIALLAAWAILMLLISATSSVPEMAETYPFQILASF